MTLRKSLVLLVTLGGLALHGGGCSSGGVGDPCTPEDEYTPGFPGYAASEVNIESRSFQCETRVCLVNHFRGRVSCPLGQDQQGLDSANPDDPAKCRIPGSRAETVTTTVLPQCTLRPASKTVYCSCRCDGPDPNAKYCECPDGYKCAAFPEFDVGAAVAKGSANLRGKYCVKQDDVTGDGRVNYNPSQCPNAVVDACDASGNCGVAVNP
jgi:hypothetical protein